jgi:hypothetical protein
VADYTVTYATNASCSKLSKKTGIQFGGGKRGTVNTFSRQSRARAIQTLQSIDKKKISTRIFFVTLTYPEVFPHLHSSCKKHLDTLSKRIARTFPESFFFWRMEYQKRGAPHFHLILFFPDSYITPDTALNSVRAWFSASWYEICNTGDPKHLLAGTNVSLMRSWKGISHYASKYFAKVDQTESKCTLKDQAGRFWGIFGRAFMPLDIYEHYISSPVYHALHRVYRKLFQLRCGKCIYYNGCYGLTLFLSDRDVINLLNLFSSYLDIPGE